MGRYAWSGLLGRTNDADRQAVEQALRLTHTEKFADQIVDTLSGGERSRVWLAMCLAQQSRFFAAGRTACRFGHRPPNRRDGTGSQAVSQFGVWAHHRHPTTLIWRRSIAMNWSRSNKDGY